MLHIGFLERIAGKGAREAQGPFFFEREPEIFVVKIRLPVPLPEKEPIFPRSMKGCPLLQKGSIGSDARPGSNENDGSMGVGGK